MWWTCVDLQKFNKSETKAKFGKWLIWILVGWACVWPLLNGNGSGLQTSIWKCFYFITEFGQMVIPLLIANSSRILCLGDFNIHVDQENDLRAKAFDSLLSDIGLLQHVCFPTHEKGHTLDLVLTDARHPPLIREPGPTLQGYVQSDHYPPCFDITTPKPHKPSKIIQFRKWSNLDLEHFKSKLTFCLADSTATSDVNTMVDVYNQTLKSCLDDLLPVQSKP